MTAASGYFNLADTQSWLAAMTQATRTPNAIGFRAASDNTAPGLPGRIDWIPKGLGVVPGGEAQDHTISAGNEAASFDVCLVAADYGELIKLHELLVACIDVNFGPPQGGHGAGGGYSVGKSSEPIRGGMVGAEAWSVTAPVVLKEPIARYYLVPTEIVSATAQTDAADNLGSEQAIPVIAGSP